MEHLGSVQIGAANWEIYKNNDGMIEGYCAYAVVNKNGERVLSIKEFFAAEAPAFRGQSV